MWLTIKSINYIITFEEWELVNETVCNDGCAHRNVNCLFLREENTFFAYKIVGSLSQHTWVICTSRSTLVDFTSGKQKRLARFHFARSFPCLQQFHLNYCRDGL